MLISRSIAVAVMGSLLAFPIQAEIPPRPDTSKTGAFITSMDGPYTVTVKVNIGRPVNEKQQKIVQNILNAVKNHRDEIDAIAEFGCKLNGRKAVPLNEWNDAGNQGYTRWINSMNFLYACAVE